MESSHDSYQVFHTQLIRTYRRRVFRRDGTSAGWLILTAPDPTTTYRRADRDGEPSRHRAS